jgi:hypothetical protein
MSDRTEGWQDWLIDNPFFQRDLRRWRRKGYGWKIPLWCVGLPVLLVLASHGYHEILSPATRRGAGLDATLGAVLFSGVALLHMVLASICGSFSFSLTQEATADRLEFIRLLPLPARELMLKIGVGRSVLRLIPMLAPLPLYVLLLAYGMVRVEDVLALYVLLAIFLFATPSTVEITTALTSRTGATTTPANKNAGAATGIVWMVGFQLTIQVVLRPLISALVSTVGGRLSQVLGPDLTPLLPLSLVLALVRLVWMPQPFYGWTVPPLPLLLGWWALSRVCRLVAGAELWTREPAMGVRMNGRVLMALPEATGRPAEQRDLRLLSGASSALLALLTAGFLWRMVISGTLGTLSGSTTPSGSIATLLVLFGGFSVLGALERLRSGLGAPAIGLAQAQREALVGMAWGLGGTLAVLLAAWSPGRSRRSRWRGCWP